ncbi:MAG: thermonuclease family protein [bacterium]
MKRWLFIAIVLLLPALAQAKDEKETYKVTKVIDGQTLELEGGEIVRLIGVSVPDAQSTDEAKKKWAENAKEFTRKLVEGRQVWLEYGKEKKDKEGRTWAFVYFNISLKDLQSIVDQSFMPFWGTAGNFMLNRMLIEYGYASTKSPFSFKYRSTFIQLEERARKKGVGMWEDFG